MVQRRLFSCLALMGCMLSPAAWGQEMARVVSTTPVIQTVSVTEPSCTSAGTAPALCGQVTQLQNRITHYNVVYEYGGKQYSIQLSNDPGPYLPVQVTPSVVAAPPITSTTIVTSAPVITRPMVVTSSAAPPLYAPLPLYAPPVYAPPVYAPPMYAPRMVGPSFYAAPAASFHFGYRQHGHHGQHRHGHHRYEHQGRHWQ